MAVIEPLEDRRLMSASGVTVDYISKIKTIDVSGTAANDNIHVVLHGTKLVVQIGEQFSEGGPVEYITIFRKAAYKVKRIVMDGGRGDDVLVIGTDIRFKGSILGGQGDDYIGGGGGNNRIDGEEGDDVIDGNRGNDVIRGGEGNDALRGDTGNDTLIGNKGIYALDGERGNDFLHSHDGENNDHLIGGDGYDTGEVDSDFLDAPEGLPASYISLEEYTPHEVT